MSMLSQLMCVLFSGHSRVPIGPHFFVYAKGKAEGLVRLEEKMAKSIALSMSCSKSVL